MNIPHSTTSNVPSRGPGVEYFTSAASGVVSHPLPSFVWPTSPSLQTCKAPPVDFSMMPPPTLLSSNTLTSNGVVGFNAPFPILDGSSSLLPAETLHNMQTLVCPFDPRTTTEVNDENFIANFSRHKTSISKTTMKVSEMKDYLGKYYVGLKNLERSVQLLDNLDGEASAVDLTAIFNDISDNLKVLEESESSVSIDNAVISAVKRKIKKRSRKRLSAQKRKLNNNNNDNNGNVKSYRQIIIEQCMRQAEDEHVRNEQMKTMRRQADTILSDVVRKKTEANYYIQLLRSISKLRDLRLKKKHTQEVVYSDMVDDDNDSCEAVVAVVENLIKMWESVLKDYTLEETGLKLMTSHPTDEDYRQFVDSIKSEERTTKNGGRQKNIYRNWRLALFGTVNRRKDLFYRNIDDFVKIRSSWDKYVTPPPSLAGEQEDILSSAIPIGWVLPPKSTVEDNVGWKKYLIR